MGLRAAVRRRGYVWGWRLRYWWMDTVEGRIARLMLSGALLLVVIVESARSMLAGLQPPTAVQTQKGYIWIIYLIIAIIAIALAYSNKPKKESAAPQDTESPSTEDGTPVKDYFGTCWIEYEDRFLLAWKIMGRDPIRAKGGK